MTSERRRRERAREGAALRFAWGSARRLRYDVPVRGDDDSPDDGRATAVQGLRSFGNILR